MVYKLWFTVLICCTKIKLGVLTAIWYYLSCREDKKMMFYLNNILYI